MAANTIRNQSVSSSNGILSTTAPATAAIAPPGGGSLIVVPAGTSAMSVSNSLRQYQTSSSALSSSQISLSPLPSASSNNSNGMSTSACIQITQRLLEYRIPSDENDQFVKRAIESLVKKLKDRRDEMDGLCQSVQFMGATHSKCVTIPRTLDGRLQVAGRKGFPHVVYSRIWRWPDVHKNELKHRANICQYGFDLKLELVCVNPYHYERVAPPLHLGDESGGGMNANSNAMSDEECSITAETSGPPNLKYGSSGGGGGGGYGAGSGPGNNDNSNTITSASSNFMNIPKRTLPPQPVFPSHNALSSRVIPSLNLHMDRLPSSASSVRRDINHLLNVPTMSCSPGVLLNRMALPFLGNGRMQPNSNHQMLHRSPVRSLTSNNAQNNGANGTNSHNNNASLRNIILPEIADLHKEQDNALWCTISYFEYCVHVGEPYRVPHSLKQVIIDGFTDPASPGRFCLGQVPNIDRTPTAEKVRLFIKHGIRLSNGLCNNKKELNKSGSRDSLTRDSQSEIVQSSSINDTSSSLASTVSGSLEESHINGSSAPEDIDCEAGAIWLENRSEGAVFVRSLYLDYNYNGAEQNHCEGRVHKIYPQSTIQVYDLNWWRQRLSDWMQRLLGHSSSSGNKSMSDIPLDLMEQLTSQCAIQCSFVKGWGSDYDRKSVTDTPCWIEIQFHDALSLLDFMLLHTSSLVPVFKASKMSSDTIYHTKSSRSSEQATPVIPSQQQGMKSDHDSGSQLSLTVDVSPSQVSAADSNGGNNSRNQSTLSSSPIRSAQPSVQKRFRMDSPN